MDTLLQDFQFALRTLRSARGYAATAILSLAVCFGANAALFTVVHSVLLRPLPFDHPDELVYVYDSFPGAGIPRAGASVLDYLDRQSGAPAFSRSALWSDRSLSLDAGGRPEQATVMTVTPSLFPLLGVSAQLGRTFTEEEGELGHEHAVVLSDAAWRDLYGGRDDAIGKTLRVNDVPHTIVGVLPRGFDFMNPKVRAWTPAAFTAEQKSEDARFDQNYDFIGRLAPGATVEQAQAQLAALDKANYDRFPQWHQILEDSGFKTIAVGFERDLVRDVEGTLYLLWGGALLVLLIGAVNVANLALIRSRSRLRELATRTALGAGRLRLARQLVTESLVVTLAGAALGLAAGWGALRGFRLLDLQELPRGTEIGMDAAVVGFVLGLAVVVAVLIALPPLLAALRADLAAVFHDDARTGSAGRSARFSRRALVVSQVALAFVLLFGAGLLLASFRRVLAVDPGFDARHVLTASVRMPSSRYPDDPALDSFTNRALEAVRALPGVASAGVTTNIPLGGAYSSSVILAEGRVMLPNESFVSPYYSQVTPGYFESMGIGLVGGRYFEARDSADAPGVVIVDEELARHFWPGQDPVGRRMYKPTDMQDPFAVTAKTRYLTVVGVVRHVAVRGPARADKTVGAYYFPYAQNPAHRITFTIRTAGDPNSILHALREKVAALDPELPLYDAETMLQRTDQSLVDRRSPLVLSVGFAAVALFLAALGIYGVLAYLVAQRRREIGIRIALGGTRRQIFELILGEGVAVLGVGFAGGLAGAALVGRGLAHQLYQVQPTNPLVLAGATALLAAVALVACVVPARRATRVEPAVALRQE